MACSGYDLDMKERVLVVDDEFNICDSIKDSLRQDYSVEIAHTGESALSILEKNLYDLVILDLALPGISGVDVLKQIKLNYPDTAVIIITASDSTKIAVDCMKSGAIDYIAKPFDLDELKICVKRVLDEQKLKRENIELKEAVNKRYVFENIIGNSPQIRKVCEAVYQAIQIDSTVIITGETGTGKELVSRTIHYNSKRKNGPFKAINCGGIPKDLLESELFGYEKGAFTGAVQTKPGLMELADGGTLLLDEISELKLDLQVKLLRVLEEKKLTRVGGTKEIKIDIRIISATNRNLQDLIKKGEFREDLFYRINVFPINLPLLRERKEDIPLLVNFFLKEFEDKFGKQTISTDAISALKKYDWHGNVRELKNVIERILISSQNKDHYSITIEDIPKELNVPVSSDLSQDINGASLEEAVSNLERNLISNALKQAKGNITQAAQMLKTSYRILKYKIDKLGLQ